MSIDFGVTEAEFVAKTEAEFGVPAQLDGTHLIEANQEIASYLSGERDSLSIE